MITAAHESPGSHTAGAFSCEVQADAVPQTAAWMPRRSDRGGVWAGVSTLAPRCVRWSSWRCRCGVAQCQPWPSFCSGALSRLPVRFTTSSAEGGLWVGLSSPMGRRHPSGLDTILRLPRGTHANTGYEATCDAAMKAFGRSWDRRWPRLSAKTSSFPWPSRRTLSRSSS